MIARLPERERAMQGSASTDVAGIGLDVEEARHGGWATWWSSGTSLASIAGQYLKTARGTASASGIPPWPVMRNEQASRSGEWTARRSRRHGISALEGYENITLDGKSSNGQAWVKRERHTGPTTRSDRDRRSGGTGCRSFRFKHCKDIFHGLNRHGPARHRRPRRDDGRHQALCRRHRARRGGFHRRNRARPCALPGRTGPANRH